MMYANAFEIDIKVFNEILYNDLDNNMRSIILKGLHSHSIFYYMVFENLKSHEIVSHHAIRSYM